VVNDSNLKGLETEAFGLNLKKFKKELFEK
jgi:hypothetical protein